MSLRRHSLACIILVAASFSELQSNLYAQASLPEGRRPWAEHLRNATVSIGLSTVSEQGKPTFGIIGTGVLVETTTSSGKLVMVATAKHILVQPDWHPSSLRIRFASEQYRTLSEGTGFEFRVKDEKGSPLWIAPDDGSDVAIFPVPPEFKCGPMSGYVQDVIAVDEFAGNDQIFEGASLVSFGFPGKTISLMGSQALLRAVTRPGMIAWVAPEEEGDAPFLIDANILPGNSGGPVFRTPGSADQFGKTDIQGKPWFVGIISAILSDQYAMNIGGMAKVEPASMIRKLLNFALPTRYGWDASCPKSD